MDKNARKPKAAKKNVKHWVAVVLFGAIIVVFALMGVNPSRMGGGDSESMGVAATVNDVAISVAEYRSRVEMVEQNAKMRFDQFPEAQRRAFSQEIRRRALEELVLGEIVFQSAQKQGVLAADNEVRDSILQISFLSENGRFMKERYRAFLQNMNLTPDDFERQVRRQVVGQKLQTLFVGSAAPTPTELKLNRELTDQKVNLRFVDFKKDDLQKAPAISEADIKAYESSHASDIEKYYSDNKVQFTQAEKVKARHILIRIDDKRNEAQALKMAQDLKSQATPENFAKLASANSDDPGSKAKGGELGEFERGHMVPEFENAAFSLKPGQISAPVKTSFGYHLIYVEGKTPGGETPIDKARDEIARKLIARGKESEILAKLNTTLAKGDKKEVESFLQKAGLKWKDSGEFDLSANVIPKLGDSKSVLDEMVKRSHKTGILPTLIHSEDRYIIVDVTSWKDTQDTKTDLEDIEQMVASRKSSDIIEAWSKEVEAKATVQRNPRVLQ